MMLKYLFGQIRGRTIRHLPWAHQNAQLAWKTSFTAFDIDRGGEIEVEEEADKRFATGAFLHHGRRPRYRNYRKFISPRKRANKLMNLLENEAVAKAKEDTPKVWEENFRVGDAVELDVVTQGGVKTTNKSDKRRMRGVILGIFRKGIDYSILIRDVIQGRQIERKIPLHSPLVRSLTVLEKNFVFKGKKRIKRAKLYYLSDKNPLRKFALAQEH